MEAGRAGSWSAWSRALAVAASFSVAACVGAPAEPETRVLRVLMADDWATVEPVVAAVRHFESAHPGVQVDVLGMPFGDIPDVVEASIAAGEPFDVAHWHAFAAAARGLAEPLDGLWARELDAEEFLPGAVEGVTWGGRRYGVPLDTNTTVLIVNTDMLEESAVALPQGPMTFADLARIARATTTPDGAQRGIALVSSSWRTYGWIQANGGEVVDIAPDGSPTFTLDTPKVVEAVEFLSGLVREGVAFPPVSHVSSDAFALFRAGQTAMHMSGTWEVAPLEEPAADLLSYAVLPLPRGTTGQTVGAALGGSSLFVPAGAQHRDLAEAFMLHLTEDRYAIRLARTEGRIPARLRVFEDPFFRTPTYEVVLEQLTTARPMKLIAFPEASRVFDEALEDILTGRRDAREALSDAQLAAERSLGEAA